MCDVCMVCGCVCGMCVCVFEAVYVRIIGMHFAYGVWSVSTGTFVVGSDFAGVSDS